MKKTVLITGASRGIGLAVFNKLNSNGKYHILRPTRDEMNLCDIESINDYQNKNSEVDIVINNAGINILRSIEDIDKDSIDSMLNVNLQAPLQIIKNAVPHMKKNKYGKILNISSIWGVGSKEYRTLYSLTKFGLNGITKALSKELGPYNIAVNSICPGYVNTEMTKKNVPPKEQEKIKKTISLRRFAEPDEIAAFANFLISDENSYITGQVLVIDGGFLT